MSDITNAESEGGYVFVSHAHKDLHEIRKIRNILEDNGLEPICFYLRCLSDNDEILDLIKREIDAREWFLLVDSKNARESNWVRTEVEYIKSKAPKKIVSVSLDKPENILPTLERLSKSMSVFISGSTKDRRIVKAIYDECLKHDFKVFYAPESLKPGDDWATSVSDALEDALKRGCVVAVISASSLNSRFVEKELSFALSQKAYVLPVIVDDVELTGTLKLLLANLQHFCLKTPVSEEQLKKIAEIIENMSILRLRGQR